MEGVKRSIVAITFAVLSQTFVGDANSCFVGQLNAPTENSTSLAVEKNENSIVRLYAENDFFPLQASVSSQLIYSLTFYLKVSSIINATDYPFLSITFLDTSLAISLNESQRITIFTDISGNIERTQLKIQPSKWNRLSVTVSNDSLSVAVNAQIIQKQVHFQNLTSMATTIGCSTYQKVLNGSRNYNKSIPWPIFNNAANSSNSSVCDGTFYKGNKLLDSNDNVTVEMHTSNFLFNISCSHLGISNITMKCSGCDMPRAYVLHDNCLNVMCVNGGRCQSQNTTFKCLCQPGYEGRLCESRIDNCVNVSCSNGGRCQSQNTTFKCLCQPGFEGRLCESRIDYCVNVSCSNGGRCQSLNTTFKCLCQPGFEGKFCMSKINYCLNVTCHNGGVCRSTHLNFSCLCKQMFEGVFCESIIRMCVNESCSGRGICIQNGTSTRCSCYPNFGGQSCENLTFKKWSINFTAMWTCLFLLIIIMLFGVFFLAFRKIKSKRSDTGVYKPNTLEQVNPVMRMEGILRLPILERFV